LPVFKTGAFNRSANPPLAAVAGFFASGRPDGEMTPKFYQIASDKAPDFALFW
jgi:hypothetical protein